MSSPARPPASLASSASLASPAPPASSDVALFEAHAATYDRINTVITFGQDARWRRWAAGEAVRRGAVVAAATVPGTAAAGAPVTAPTTAPASAAAPSPRAPRLLDACAGTGLVGLAAAELGARVTLADASPLMLARARGRAAARRLAVDDVVVDLAALSPPAATGVSASQPGASPGEAAPLAPASFDAVTLAFGLRYLPDPVATLRALAAMLRPGGVVVALEAVVPTASSATTPTPGAGATTTRAASLGMRIASAAAGLYFFRVAPRIGALLAGRRDLYIRLTGSVRDLGDGDDLAGLFTSAGLTVVSRRAWVFGLVEGLVAERPPAPVESGVEQPSPPPVPGVLDGRSRGSVCERPAPPPPGQ